MHRIILITHDGYLTEDSTPGKLVYSDDRWRAQRFETEVDALLRAVALGLKADEVDTETYAVA